MDIITFINSLTNEDFNRIRNSKSDAEARRLLREHQALQLQQTGVSSSYLPLTLVRIIEIVDRTKDLTEEEQIKIAYSMPMTACVLYVLNMKSRHNISVSI